MTYKTKLELITFSNYSYSRFLLELKELVSVSKIHILYTSCIIKLCTNK